MGRQSGSSNAGLARLREKRLRRDDDGGGTQVAYSNRGIPQDLPGDDQAPWSKQPPFPSDPIRWLETTFQGDVSAGANDVVPMRNYGFLPVLEIGHVRTITTWLEFVGAPSQDSVFSLLPGSVLPDAEPPEFVSQTATAADITDTQTFARSFYPFGVVDLSPTNITLLSAFPASAPAISREAMPSEFRSQTLNGADAEARTLRFSLEWEVAPYSRFSLAVADLSASTGADQSTLSVFYSYSL